METTKLATEKTVFVWMDPRTMESIGTWSVVVFRPWHMFYKYYLMYCFLPFSAWVHDTMVNTTWIIVPRTRDMWWRHLLVQQPTRRELITTSSQIVLLNTFRHILISWIGKFYIQWVSIFENLNRPIAHLRRLYNYTFFSLHILIGVTSL